MAIVMDTIHVDSQIGQGEKINVCGRSRLGCDVILKLVHKESWRDGAYFCGGIWSIVLIVYSIETFVSSCDE